MAGIYFHIPFCKTRCVYCDFYSNTRTQERERYIDALCRELTLRKGYLHDEEVETIYFGGGTPSQLRKEDFEKVFDTIHAIYGEDNNREITIEANPDDLNLTYIKQLAGLPFNRISIGIQTFDDDILRLLGRRHTSSQALQAVKACREAGFGNISIDLMYGLPGETLPKWEKDLKQAIDLQVEHISAYHLIYEENTPLWEMLRKRQVKESDEDDSVAFFSEMMARLKEAGFIHYEISNFCRPGKFSRHNSGYWTGKKYLGCGASAHSFNTISREWNVPSLQKYLKGIEEETLFIEKEELDLYTRYNDFIITSLRTVWGLPLGHLEKDFGKELYEYCLKNAKNYLDTNKLYLHDDTLFLSEEGVFISDGIMSDLLWVED